MIAQWQPTMGWGCSRQRNDLNMIGNSVTTRFLFSVMLSKCYGGKLKNKPLMSLVTHLATELRSMFYSRIDVNLNGKRCKFYLVCIGAKGDWAGLCKIGTLNRSFMTDAPTKPFGKGICHKCRAGQEGHPWHEIDFQSMQLAHQDPPLPWKRPSPLTLLVPGDETKLPEFFKCDLFHTAHKGIVADAAANAVVIGLCLGIFCTLGIFRQISVSYVQFDF